MQEILGDIGGIIRFSGGAKGGSVVANIVQRGGLCKIDCQRGRNHRNITELRVIG